MEFDGSFWVASSVSAMPRTFRNAGSVTTLPSSYCEAAVQASSMFFVSGQS